MLLKAFFTYLLNDFTGNAYVYAYGAPSNPHTLPFWPNRALLVWTFWIRTWLQLDMAHSLVAAGTTLWGVYSPRDWPPMFGLPWDLWTLRRFWGQTWHQLQRRPLSSIGIATARGLGFRKGTMASRYTQLYVAFAISGLIHAGGATMAIYHDMGTLRFFILQALAITTEDIVIAVAKKLGFRAGLFGKLVGYLWVAAWMAWSGDHWVAEKIAVGTYQLPGFVPYSFAEWFGIHGGSK
ncbi:hypothetical protein GP486_002814 [Trichoglossum hirsutum]|uniref:Wax synthase domain-containing protein n=1 Tax=Trichoglossum hirsutum TaxID=265104 RepID=A0A9P8LEC8_9PEZI|nr:hypothetical protein GP486_002814 [Trichoglossum hirsutum]